MRSGHGRGWGWHVVERFTDSASFQCFKRFRSVRCLGSSVRSNLDTSVSGATGEGRTDCNPELPGGTVEVERDKTPGAVRGARLRRGRTSRIISDAVFCVRSKSKTSGGGGGVGPVHSFSHLFGGRSKERSVGK